MICVYLCVIYMLKVLYTGGMKIIAFRNMHLKKMSNLILLSFILSVFFIYSTTSSSSFVNTTYKCSIQQTHALLLFKQSLSSINDTMYDYICEDWLGSGYNPVMMNWNASTDCCAWDGVTCDQSTSDVIGLDLSCGMLQGTIHHNTTLFHLPHLQRLNLAYNNFFHSQLPPHMGMVSNSLTHLNISSCGFTGQFPTNILHLSKLVSLDLSWSGIGFYLKPHVFINLLRNSTIMEDLSLEGVNISSVLPANLNISSSLRMLNLGNTNLQGTLLHNIFSLQSLEKLDLSFNSFTGYIPSEISLLPKLYSLDLSLNGMDNLLIQPHVFINLLKNSTVMEELLLTSVSIFSVLPTDLNISSSLRLLNLGSTRLQGNLPHNIFNLQSLETLDLSFNNFIGNIPSGILLLPKLVSLDLTLNGMLLIQPHIFSIFLQNSTFLRDLQLGGVNIGLVLPTYLNISSSLRSLSLGYTGLQGKLPNNILSLKYLEELYLFGNNYLTGPLPKVNISTSIPLSTFSLSHTSLSGEIPTSIGHLNFIVDLDLSHCGLNGSLPKSLVNLKHLVFLDLSFNMLSGTMPSSLFTLRSVESIDLSNNLFRGIMPLELFSLRSIKQLSLANNQLIGQIDVHDCGPILQTFQKLTNLTDLDLSYNSFRGDWELDTLLSSLTNLKTLILSHSGLSVTTSNANHYVNPNFELLSLASCSLKVFPVSLQGMTALKHLDLSSNGIQGHIPDWVGEIGRNQLLVFDISNNSITDTIPNVYAGWGGLEGFILNGNQLEGKVPTSLHKCQNLKIIDLGNNHLNDTFPVWLGDLPKLQALVLRSNNFHGGIVTFSMVKFPFPSLRVLDLSRNGFVGQVPTKYIQNFNAMKNVVKKNTKPEYVQINGMYYTIIVAVKGKDRDFPRLLVDFTIVDLSNNKFEREIPNIIGNLNSLKVLNLSHNTLTGQIPQALGKISEIESLDLSCNQLKGEIPKSLIDLTFLEFLNLSQNHLVGRIPQGNQFDTFERNSFGGNPKLCGLPLRKKCIEHLQEPQLEVHGYGDIDDESGFTWKVVGIGYGCGILLGVVLGYLMLSTGRPKWFSSIVDAAENIIMKSQNKRRVACIM